MKLRQIFPIALLAASSAFAQNPQGQFAGDPNSQNNQIQQNAAAGILEHGSGLDQGNIGPFVTLADKQFAQLLTLRAMMQLELGKAALERGSSAQVKAVAQRMVDDYGKWQGGLNRAAVRLEIKLPTELDAKRKATAARILALGGAEFDQEYLKEVVRIQNRALTATQYEAANAGVSGFRQWAGVMMPTLEEHLKLTKSLSLSASK